MTEDLRIELYDRFTGDDAALVVEMMAQLGHGTVAALARTALWRLAQALVVDGVLDDCPSDRFALSQRRLDGGRVGERAPTLPFEET